MDWENKKYIKVLQPTKDCRLKLSELLIYSFLAYQDHYEVNPTQSQIVRGTGLGKQCVKSALERLAKKGLYDESIQPPPENWFYERKKENAEHWRETFAYWHYFVRRPDSPLTTLQSAVLSWCHHLKSTDTKFRLSLTYIALILCSDRRGIKYALDELMLHGYLVCEITRQDGIKGLKIKKLGQSDLDELFQNNRPSEPTEIEYLTPEQIELDQIGREAEDYHDHHTPTGSLDQNIMKYLDKSNPAWRQYYDDLPVKVFNWLSRHAELGGKLEDRIEKALDEILQK